MTLTDKEKASIANLEYDEVIEFADYDRSDYQYEVEKPSTNEYRVSKFAIWCLAVEYFGTPEEVINYIEK